MIPNGVQWIAWGCHWSSRLLWIVGNAVAVAVVAIIGIAVQSKLWNVSQMFIEGSSSSNGKVESRWWYTTRRSSRGRRRTWMIQIFLVDFIFFVAATVIIGRSSRRRRGKDKYSSFVFFFFCLFLQSHGPIKARKMLPYSFRIRLQSMTKRINHSCLRLLEDCWTEICGLLRMFFLLVLSSRENIFPRQGRSLGSLWWHANRQRWPGAGSSLVADWDWDDQIPFVDRLACTVRDGGSSAIKHCYLTDGVLLVALSCAWIDKMWRQRKKFKKS